MKKTVLIIFGGNSDGHDVSLRSAATILSYIDMEKYYALPLGITTDGRWLLYNGSAENIAAGEWKKIGTPAILSPDTSHSGIMKLVGNTYRLIKADVCLPVLCGNNSEEGAIQALLELSGIPYVNMDAFSSKVWTDKCSAKSVCGELGIAQTKYLRFSKTEASNFEELYRQVKTELGFPCYVKPPAAGLPSCAASVANKKALEKSVQSALDDSDGIIIEKAEKGRKIAVAVMGNKEPAAFVLGEIADEKSEKKTIAFHDLPAGKAEEISETAIKVYKAIDGEGLILMDFLLDKKDNVIFSDASAFFGFTSISMLPMLFNNNETIIGALLDRLIACVPEK